MGMGMGMGTMITKTTTAMKTQPKLGTVQIKPGRMRSMKPIQMSDLVGNGLFWLVTACIVLVTAS